MLKKSVIVPDFEKKDAVPPYSESKHAAKLKRKVSTPVHEEMDGVIFCVFLKGKLFI